MNHLKNAEQKASELVSAAKNSKSQFGQCSATRMAHDFSFLWTVDRTSQIRQAKVEAEAEIARYKAEQEAAYQAALAKVKSQIIFIGFFQRPHMLTVERCLLFVPVRFAVERAITVPSCNSRRTAMFRR